MSGFNSTQYKRLWDAVVTRDGAGCRQAHEGGCSKQMVLDHKDNNRNNNRLDNLQILCRAHNYLKNPRGSNHYATTPAHTPTPDLDDHYTRSARERKRYEEWVAVQVTSHGRIVKDEAVFSGMALCSMSKRTVGEWLQALCSSVGAYETVRDGENPKVYWVQRKQAVTYTGLRIIKFEEKK